MRFFGKQTRYPPMGTRTVSLAGFLNAQTKVFGNSIKEDISFSFSHSQDYNTVAELVDNYMGHLYPDYDHTRSVLVRQARDLLLCTYHGNLLRLEEEFLAPGANLIAVIKRACEAGQVSELH